MVSSRKLGGLTFASLLFSTLAGSCFSAQCGRQAHGALCPGGLCCSKDGWCGNSDEYCDDGCQSQCDEDLGRIISRPTFDHLLKPRNNTACPAIGFYTYDAFVSAAKSFPGFATTGDIAARKREIVAFFARTSRQTTGWSWGYCFVKEPIPSTYCSPSSSYPCAPQKHYYGRGPIQLTWNYNYGKCGKAIGVDLLNNPDLVATDPVVSFKTAIWFWMTPQPPKPSSHDVITGLWSPSWLAGYWGPHKYHQRRI